MKETDLYKIIDAVPASIYWKDKYGAYLGCNKYMVDMAKANSREDIFGKKDIDMPWSGFAPRLNEIDQYVINNRCKYEVEEEPTLPDGSKKVFLTTKTPLYDDAKQVIGLIGVSIDITEKKQAELLKKQSDALKIEAAMQKTKVLEKEIAEQQKFAKIVRQMAHDIRSPLATLSMILKSCENLLPEDHRVGIRKANDRITDIVGQVLNHYQEESEEEIKPEQSPKALLLSATLLELLMEKKFAYQDTQIEFEYRFAPDSQFTFIEVQPSDFKRMLSNLINNAVESLEGRHGKIILSLESEKNKAKIKISDNGKGMSAEFCEKILCGTHFSKGKIIGYGIGLAQVKDTLEKSDGKLMIESELGVGSTFILEFPKTAAPDWIANTIKLNHDDIIVVLDDDPSIHRAWATRFTHVLQQYPQLSLQSFSKYQDALSYILNLDSDCKSRVFLLTDYELLGQEFNGLQLVEQAQIKRSILTTSHYANATVREEAQNQGTPILPKQLASEIDICITRQPKQKLQNKVDIILVDDDRNFIKAVQDIMLIDYKVDCFFHPRELMNNLADYSKSTPISLDNNYADGTKGIDIAKALHEKGYQNLYLLTGETLTLGTYPDWLKIIRKDKIDEFVNVLDENPKD